MSEEERRNRRLDQSLDRALERERNISRQEGIERRKAERLADELRSRRFDEGFDEIFEQDAKLFRQERLQQREPGPVAPVGGDAVPAPEKK